eukprot:1486861-Rhodomonas_salina.1
MRVDPCDVGIVGARSGSGAGIGIARTGAGGGTERTGAEMGRAAGCCWYWRRRAEEVSGRGAGGETYCRGAKSEGVYGESIWCVCAGA